MCRRSDLLLWSLEIFGRWARLVAPGINWFNHGCLKLRHQGHDLSSAHADGSLTISHPIPDLSLPFPSNLIDARYGLSGNPLIPIPPSRPPPPRIPPSGGLVGPGPFSFSFFSNEAGGGKRQMS